VYGLPRGIIRLLTEFLEDLIISLIILCSKKSESVYRQKKKAYIEKTRIIEAKERKSVWVTQGNNSAFDRILSGSDNLLDNFPFRFSGK
jgi:hypothetical protein